MLEGREHYQHLVNEICVSKNYLSHGYYSQVYNYGDEYVVKKLSNATNDGALFWLMYCMYAHATGNGCRVMPRVKEFFWDENRVAYAVVERLRPIPEERFSNIREAMRSAGVNYAVRASQFAAAGVSTKHIRVAQDNSDSAQFIRHVLILAALSGVGFQPDLHGANLMYRGGQVVYNDPIVLASSGVQPEAKALFAILKRLCPLAVHGTSTWIAYDSGKEFAAEQQRIADLLPRFSGGMFLGDILRDALRKDAVRIASPSKWAAPEHPPHPRAWGGNPNFENLQQRHIKGVQHGNRR